MSKTSAARWAALFDWDGVVVDSSCFHERSWDLLARENKKDLPPDHFKKGFGRTNHYIIPHILGWTKDPGEIERLANRKEELYRQLVAVDGIEPIPGTREWLEELEKAGIPRIIGSSTHRLNIETVLEIASLKRFFSEIVSAEDVTHGKPDPEVFLKAADKLGMPPAQCVVFEDTHFGIEAARNAGMKVVALTTTHPENTLQDADRVVDRLDQLCIEQMNLMFS
jgi:beta-phosphoglucomutase family hydrolase